MKCVNCEIEIIESVTGWRASSRPHGAYCHDDSLQKHEPDPIEDAPSFIRPASLGESIAEDEREAVVGGQPLTVDELLVILMEECGEVIQAASKCLRFGYERKQTDYGVNDEVLAAEIGDVLGIVDALPLKAHIVEATRRMKLQKAQNAKKLYGANHA